MNFKKFENKIWLASPCMHGEEQAFVKDAFDTNWVSTVGANINALEEEIAEISGCKYTVALSAGTAALHLSIKLAIQSLNAKKEDVVVFCSDLTFAATINPAAYEGLRIVFVDSEYDTWNMDPLALRKAFEYEVNKRGSNDFKGIVIVADLYGTPAKLEEILAVCNEYNAVLIEDAAEALGASYNGKPCGSFGYINAISFNGNKIITTSGGGMLTTDDKIIADHARKLSTQARDLAPWYEHTETGYNYRMSNILAGIGRGQLIHLKEHIERKKEIYKRYEEGFKDLPLSLNPILNNSSANYWLSCILIEKQALSKHERTANTGCYAKDEYRGGTDLRLTCPDEIRDFFASHNIESRPIWKPMHMQPVYSNCDFATKYGVIPADKKRNTDGGYVVENEEEKVLEEFNGFLCASEDIFDRGLCMPSDINMDKGQQDIIVSMVRALFGR